MGTKSKAAEENETLTGCGTWPRDQDEARNWK
jgi:hypothetical protein